MLLKELLHFKYRLDLEQFLKFDFGDAMLTIGVDSQRFERSSREVGRRTTKSLGERFGDFEQHLHGVSIVAHFPDVASTNPSQSFCIFACAFCSRYTMWPDQYLSYDTFF